MAAMDKGARSENLAAAPREVPLLVDEAPAAAGGGMPGRKRKDREDGGLAGDEEGQRDRKRIAMQASTPVDLGGSYRKEHRLAGAAVVTTLLDATRVELAACTQAVLPRRRCQPVARAVVPPVPDTPDYPAALEGVARAQEDLALACTAEAEAMAAHALACTRSAAAGWAMASAQPPQDAWANLQEAGNHFVQASTASTAATWASLAARERLQRAEAAATIAEAAVGERPQAPAAILGPDCRAALLAVAQADEDVLLAHSAQAEAARVIVVTMTTGADASTETVEACRAAAAAQQALDAVHWAQQAHSGGACAVVGADAEPSRAAVEVAPAPIMSASYRAALEAVARAEEDLALAKTALAAATVAHARALTQEAVATRQQARAQAALLAAYRALAAVLPPAAPGTPERAHS